MCMVIVIVTGAMVFGRFLAVTRIPFDIAAWVVGLPIPKECVVGIIFLIYIIGGAVMDALALLLITIPIFFPVAAELGYDPIWFCILLAVNLQTSFLTPPFGFSLFYLKAVTPPEVVRVSTFSSSAPSWPK